LNLDVVMPCATRVGRWNDGAKVESAVRPGDDVATISETDVVVFALLIGMPEIDHCSAKRAAASRQHSARKFKRTACRARPAQVAALRRSWFEKRALGLADGRFVAIVTERCGASSCVRAASVQDSSHPAASMPVLSRNWRRVGGLFMSIAKLLIEVSLRRAAHLIPRYYCQSFGSTTLKIRPEHPLLNLPGHPRCARPFLT
jgi:hypothetical protein